MRLSFGLWWLVLVAVGCGDSFTADGAGGVGGVGGTGTGTAVTTGGGGVGGAGGTSTGAENCLDGIDNDGDDRIDCQDSDCQPDFECAPPIPQGWSNIGFLSMTPGTPCPDSAPTTEPLYEEGDIDAPETVCACDCNPPTGVQCRLPLRCWANAAGCINTPEVNIGVGAGCSTFSKPVASDDSVHCQLDEPVAQGGTCQPSFDETVQDYTWPAAAQVCTQSAPGYCADEGACVPAAPAGDIGPCVFKSGSQPCPSSYPEQHLFDSGAANDSRGCTPCSCGSVQGSTCTCNSCGAQIWAGSSCAGATQTLTTTACTPLTISLATTSSARRTGAAAITVGTCSSTGGESTGEVTANGQITVCCAAD